MRQGKRLSPPFFNLRARRTSIKLQYGKLQILPDITAYRYFEDVFALIEYAEDDFLQKTKEVLDEQRKKQTVGERQFFEIMIHCFYEHADRIAILMSEQNHSHFVRRLQEKLPNIPCNTKSNISKMNVIKDIYFYGLFHAISINLQSKDALPDEDLLDIIQNLFSKWYLPELQQDEW